VRCRVGVEIRRSYADRSEVIQQFPPNARGAFTSMRYVLAALALVACFPSPISLRSAGSGPGTQGELDRLLARWQSRLGLSACTIQARLVLPNSLEDGDVVADITFNDDDLTAKIRVEQASLEQVEDCLLHELVHLLFEAWRPPKNPDEEEKTVDTVAQALLTSRKPQ
jgi:hypothetical protein